MVAGEDDFTSTVDGAAGFERSRGFEPYDGYLNETADAAYEEAIYEGPETLTDEEIDLEEQAFRDLDLI